MRLHKRNYLNETWRQERRRRLEKLEYHINDLEQRLIWTQNRINILRERLGFCEDDSDNTGPERGADNRADRIGDSEFRGSEQDSSSY